MTDDEWFTDPGDPSEVFRRGDTIHHSTREWTPTIVDLLVHLEDVGIDKSPRHLGYDEGGRQIYTFLDGEDGPVSWSYLHTDEGLASIARLLRSYHDAVHDYVPPDDVTWANAAGPPKDGQFVCHGDFAPCNLVWRDKAAAGIFEWEFAIPAEPMYDVYHAMDWAVPFRDDETCRDFHHFETIPDRAHRVAVFLEAYGVDSIPAEVAAGVVDVRRRTGQVTTALAARGLERQAEHVAQGSEDSRETLNQWIEAHAELFQPRPTA